MHNAHRKQTANAHPFSSGGTCSRTCSRSKHHDHQKEKHRNENEKTRRGSRTLVYALSGTSFNRRTKHRLSNLPRCLTRFTNMQEHSRDSGNENICNVVATCLYSLFSLPPPRGWSPQTNICLTFRIQKKLISCTVDIHQLKKNSQIPDNLWRGIY